VVVRDASPEDSAALVDILTAFPRRSANDDPHAEACAAVARIAADPDQRLLVALVQDVVVGAAHLVRAPLSPLCGETAVHMTHLQVSDAARRHGVGRALIEASVSWAEEKDDGHLLVVAPMNSRDANRFLARLGLAQVAVVRASSITALRSKLPVEPPAAARMGSRSHRSVGTVLAQRRSQRRAQNKAE
jgi:GNAT superfamily N-acetyltransferase